MQNRAIEGDEVALQILPPCQWFISGSMLERGEASKAGDDRAVSASPRKQPLQPDLDAASSSRDGASPVAQRCSSSLGKYPCFDMRGSMLFSMVKSV